MKEAILPQESSEGDDEVPAMMSPEKEQEVEEEKPEEKPEEPEEKEDEPPPVIVMHAEVPSVFDMNAMLVSTGTLSFFTYATPNGKDG